MYKLSISYNPLMGGHISHNNLCIQQIHPKQYKTKNTNNNSFLPLKIYEELARAFIKKYAKKFGLIKEMLDNEDAICFVMFHMMRGDYRYKPTKQTIDVHRAICAHNAIRRYKYQLKATRLNCRMLSIDKDALNHITSPHTVMDEIILNEEINLWKLNHPKNKLSQYI